MGKNFLIILFCSIFLPSQAFAVTIELKSGDVLEGEIVERTDEWVKMDTGLSIPVTYYFDEIEAIDGIKQSEPPQEIQARGPDVVFIDLYEKALQIFPDDPEEATRLVSKLQLLAMYDIKRVADKSAHQAWPALKQSLSPIYMWALHHPQIYREILQETVEWARNTPPPDYSPEWMIHHGMDMMTATLKGQQAPESFNPNHDPERDWSDAIAQVVNYVEDDPEAWQKLERDAAPENAFNTLKERNGTGAPRQTETGPAPSFDGRNWNVGLFEKNAQQSITAYLLEGDTPESAVEVVSIEEYFGVQSHVAIHDLMKAILERMSRKCPNMTSNIITQSERDLIYEWDVRDCPDSQYYIARIAYARDRAFVMNYASKIPITPDKRAEWVKIINGIVFQGTSANETFSEKKTDQLNLRGLFGAGPLDKSTIWIVLGLAAAMAMMSGVTVLLRREDVKKEKKFIAGVEGFLSQPLRKQELSNVGFLYFGEYQGWPLEVLIDRGASRKGRRAGERYILRIKTGSNLALRFVGKMGGTVVGKFADSLASFGDRPLKAVDLPSEYEGFNIYTNNESKALYLLKEESFAPVIKNYRVMSKHYPPAILFFVADGDVSINLLGPQIKPNLYDILKKPELIQSHLDNLVFLAEKIK